MGSTLMVERPIAFRAPDMAIDDGELLRALHEEHGGVLWCYVVGLTNGDRAHAPDVVQETVQRAGRKRQVLAQGSGSTHSWLFTVALRALRPALE